MRRVVVPALTAVALLTAIGLTIWIWEPATRTRSCEGALNVDALSLGVSMLFYVAGLVTIALSLRSTATAQAGHGEYYSLLLGSITGMVVLAEAQSLMTLFIGFELLSIPLYVLCATHLHRRTSLEAGLKYLVVGSVGSATLLYGLALIYGATGALRFDGIALALARRRRERRRPAAAHGHRARATGLAFKASVAPFHQWTPDVYQGAPTPITTFMAVATKAAAFAVFLRLFDHALGLSQLDWGPALAFLAATTIVIGNVGAIAQRSLKRMLAWSSVAQAGYLLAGVVVGHPARRSGDRVLPRRLPADERGGLRGRRRARARVRVRRRPALLREPRHDGAAARVAHDDRDALAGRLPRHRAASSASSI